MRLEENGLAAYSPAIVQAGKRHRRAVIRPQLDLNLIRVFLAVYDARSVSRAAVLLGAHQPAVSIALQKLRRELGDPLFVRTAHGMHPTPAAEHIAEPLRSALTAIDKSFLLEPFDPSRSHDELRVLTGDILETPVFLRVLSIIQEKIPHATCRSVSIPSENIEAALEAGEIDLAIGHFPQLVSANLYTALIAQFTFRCFCRLGHPLASRTMSLEEFCEAPHVVAEPACSITQFIEDWLSSQHITRNVVLRTSHFSSVPPILRASDLVAVLPSNFRGSWFYPGSAACLQTSFEMPVSEMRAYWHRAVHGDSRHKWWRDRLFEKLRRGAHRSMQFTDGDEVDKL